MLRQDTGSPPPTSAWSGQRRAQWRCARGRGTISRSQRGSLSAGDAQQPAGLISTSVARASHSAPGAIPWRGPVGPSTAMSTSLPEASAASDLARTSRHLQVAQASRQRRKARCSWRYPARPAARRRPPRGLSRAVKRERDEIVLVPGDPQCRALRERSFGDDLDQGACRHGTGIGRHKPAEGRGWGSHQSGWRWPHSP